MPDETPTDGAPERLTRRLAGQWSMMRREERHPPPAPAPPLRSGYESVRASSRPGIPWGLDLAAAYAWRFLLIVAAGYLIVRTLGFLEEVTVPVAIALLLSALLTPVVRFLSAHGLRRGPASLLVVITTLLFVGALLALAGQQVANGANDLARSTADGLGEIKDWLRNGPLHASDSQVNDYIQKAQDAITNQVDQGNVAGKVTEVGSAVSKIFAGFFIVLFSTYFFLADGDRIWAFVVRLSPRAARERVDSSGRVAWISLTQFVRATVIVAATDAIGISVGAAVLQVPFVLAIGVLVFLGAFVPLVGAFVAGAVAVLVALVSQGPIVALVMLGVVVAVQQLEAHVLQPFLMGRWVSVHPLGVIFAIATGVLVAGIVGALVAVPFAATINAVVQHLAGFDEAEDEPEHGSGDPEAPDQGPIDDEGDEGAVGDSAGRMNRGMAEDETGERDEEDDDA